MVRRSVLFTPGDRPEMMRKAPGSGADVLVFDLEDAVAPGRKGRGRETVRDCLADPSFDPDAEVCLRVNPVGAGATEDLAAVLEDGIRLDAVVAPKVASPSDVEELASSLADAGHPVPILALIESARGVLAADRIAAAEATDALIFGAEDLAADVGASRTDDGLEVLYARQRVVIAAAAEGCAAIDTVYTAFDDEAGLREETALAVEFGYDGKLAIHPAQVGPINETFTPEESEIEWATAVLEGAKEAAAADRGVFEVDGEMIDAPLLARAERIRERAEAAGRQVGPD